MNFKIRQAKLLAGRLRKCGHLLEHVPTKKTNDHVLHFWAILPLLTAGVHKIDPTRYLHSAFLRLSPMTFISRELQRHSLTSRREIFESRNPTHPLRTGGTTTRYKIQTGSKIQNYRKSRIFLRNPNPTKTGRLYDVSFT
jgi:hypothetical protein